MYTLYRINCITPKHVYIGISQKPFKRIWNHLRKDGAKFTRNHGVKSFILIKEFDNEKEALKAEHDEVVVFKQKNPDFIVAGSAYTSDYGIDHRKYLSMKLMGKSPLVNA